MPPAIAGRASGRSTRQNAAPRVESQRPRGLDQRRGTLEKRRAREQVDVRIEHRDEHRRGAAERAHVGKPVVAFRPAEGPPHCALHGPGIVEPVRVRIRHHVRGHRKRQQQCPFEEARAGKAPVGDEPCGERSAERDAGTDQDDERDGVGDESRQHCCREVPPRSMSRRESEAQHRNHGQRRERRQHHRDSRKRRPATHRPAQTKRDESNLLPGRRNPLDATCDDYSRGITRSQRGRAGCDGYNRRVPCVSCFPTTTATSLPAWSNSPRRLHREPRSPSSRPRPIAAAHRTRSRSTGR